MNTSHSNFTGRTNRSLSDALGPYARGPIDDGSPRWSTADHIVVWSSVCAAAVLAVLIIVGWLP